MNFFNKLFSSKRNVDKTEASKMSLEELIRTGEKNNLIELVEQAIRNGSDPNETDFHGNTPLRYATSKPKVVLGSPPLKHGIKTPESVIKYLIDNGAKVNVMNKRGRSPLHYAAHDCDAYFAEILLKNGADPNICDPDYEGETPLMTACILLEDMNPVIELLLQYGADINKRDINAATALHVAALSGNKTIYDFLVEKGADTNAKNSKGMTAKDLGEKHYGEDWID